MSCTYQKHAKHQEERIRYFEQELQAARVEMRKLRAENYSNSTNFVNSDNWIKPNNSISRCHMFFADYDLKIKLNKIQCAGSRLARSWSAKPSFITA
jgi:hypothetical protein